jgi:hypothetical protein
MFISSPNLPIWAPLSAIILMYKSAFEGALPGFWVSFPAASNSLQGRSATSPLKGVKDVTN